MEQQLRAVLAERRQATPNYKRVAELQSQLDNLVHAIALGGIRSSPAIGRKLAEVEAELGQLQVAQQPAKVVPLVTNLRARLEAAVAELPRSLEADPERARAALRDVLGPQITLRPATDGRYLNAEIDLEIVPLGAVANGMSEKLVAGGPFGLSRSL